MRYPSATESVCHSVASTKAGPKDAALGEAEWTKLEAEASRLVGQASPRDVERLHEVGAALEHDLPVLAGSCYKIGLAGASGRRARVSVAIDGQPGSAFSVPREGAAPPRVCANASGKVQLTIIPAEGGIARLEFALATAQEHETPEARVERQRAEETAREHDRASVNTNLFLADLKHAGPAAADACQACRKMFAECTTGHERNCIEHFDVCSRSVGKAPSTHGICAVPR
jgi:hypothetical protein